MDRVQHRCSGRFIFRHSLSHRARNERFRNLYLIPNLYLVDTSDKTHFGCGVSKSLLGFPTPQVQDTVGVPSILLRLAYRERVRKSFVVSARQYRRAHSSVVNTNAETSSLHRNI